MKRSIYDKKDSLELGLKAQQRFTEYAKNEGWEVHDSSEYEDINEHWDKRIIKDTYDFKVDVKGMKRISRNDQNVQDEWHWVELHGVRENDKGWMYNGKADLIAFETKKGFIMIKRERLINLIDSTVDFKGDIVFNPNNAHYKIYKRSHRQDKITLIETEKIKKYSEGVLNG